ncbi:UNVERIFIED_ORG: hypothetical protein ABIB52_004701 [Arthrobacter sp. UYCu721]
MKTKVPSARHNSEGTIMRLLRLFIALLLAAAVAVALPVTAQAVDLGEPGPSYAGDGVRTPTADKAQSKLWFQDGSWWGLLWSASANATKIHRLDIATQAWKETETVVDARPNARGDALWDAKDGKLYVVSGTTVLSEWSSPPSQGAVTSGSAELHRFSYNASTKTYSRDAGFPVTLHSGSSESITLAKDSVGKLWVTYTLVSADNSNRVYVNHSTTSDTVWGTPFVLPTTNAQVHHDDISAVTSFQGDKIGIMWSNQRPEHKKFYLAIHQDGQPENSWQTEVAYGGGNNCTGGCANDHLNLKQLTSDGSGRLYAAIKTAAQKVGQTFVALLVRDSKAHWTSAQFGAVEDAHTRPMVMIDEEHRQVWMFAVAPEEGGTVYYKKAPLDNVSFPPGAGTPIISSSTDKDINDPTSTKQNVNGQTGLVVLAASRTNARYWHAHIDLGDQSTPPGGGDTTAPTVTAVSPDDKATGVAVNTNVTGTFSEAMNASTVTSDTFTLTAGTTTVPAAVTYNSTDKLATLNPSADLTVGTTYTATIKGGSSGVKDVAGNALASDKTWTFTTATAGGGTSETVTLTATADSYVSSGATGANYGTSTTLVVDNSPVEVTYLKFDLSAYAGRTLESATLQLHSAANASTGKQNVKLVADDLWNESVITYNNRPLLGTSIIGTLGPTTTNTTYSVPLTVSSLTGELGQQLSLGLDSSSSDGLVLNSREAGSTLAPKLVLALR